MLAGQCPTDVDAVLKHLFGRAQYVLNLLLVAIIIKKNGMDVPIAGVEDVVDHQPMLATDLIHLCQHLREHAARHTRILRAIARADLADGAEGALPRLPELGPFVWITAYF